MIVWTKLIWIAETLNLKKNFTYDEEERVVLNDINLLIAGGKMTSLVGHSGAGKSTILNLIPRFYDPQSGDIKIDDQSIYSKRLSSLRNNISLVLETPCLMIRC